MIALRSLALPAWATRDLLRRPGEALLAGLAIAALVAVVGTSLLLVEGVGRAAEALARSGPALIVRRLDAGGWAPMPLQAGMDVVTSVRGVLRPRPRLWGVLAGPRGAVTLVGCDEGMRGELGALGIEPPASGEAIVGEQLADLVGGSLTLSSEDRWDTLDVRAAFGASSSLATFDVVLVDQEAARWLLGIPEGSATDLALDVFHEGEAEALAFVLAQSFGFPVRILVRADVEGAHRDVLLRRGSLAVIAALPATLALVLLVVGVARDRLGRSREVGLLKTLGWTTGDVVALQMLRALLVGLPGAALGVVASWGMVIWPGSRWPAGLLLGWQDGGPALGIDPCGAALVLLELAGLVLAPWLLAVAWPVLRGASRDPQALLEDP